LIVDAPRKIGGQAHLTQRFIEQVSIAGFDRGLLSMIRTAAPGNQSSRYVALRAVNRDVLVITGDQVFLSFDPARVQATNITVRAAASNGTHREE
jgi:hypothetical protein